MNFDNWKKTEKHKGHFFIGDGILDKEAWSKANVKVLFLMKEAYEINPNESDEWNLNDYLSSRSLNDIGKQMWWTIAQWLKGIDHLNEHQEVPPFNPNFRDDNHIDTLFKSCAIVNIKKSAGKSRSNDEDLKGYVESDWELTMAQIKEINPDLIICGSTYPLIKNKLTNPVKSNEWFYEAEGYMFVDYWHPSVRWPYKVKYYSILSALHQSIGQWSPRLNPPTLKH